MNFKKEYEKAFADISASDDFKRQLAKELNSAASPRKRYTPYIGGLAVAAAVALMVGAVYSTGIFRDAQGAQDMKESLVAQESSGVEGNKDIIVQPSLGAEGGNNDAYGQFYASSASWCAGVESDDEKYELFVEFLSGEETEALYASSEQGFTDDDLLEAGQIAELAEQLVGAVSAENATETNVMYYKAVLKDDKTIVFQIWDEEFVRIAGVDTVYRILK
ncbi:MAG: hypothetical protein E7292_00730 [Lachnospiraceae bacterium]|nr:hypothetical protein [Lachnospiraceae bacterium]